MPPVPRNRFQKYVSEAGSGVLVWDMPRHSGGRGWRIAEKFQASLSYMVSSVLARAIVRPCLEKVRGVAGWLSEWRLPWADRVTRISPVESRGGRELALRA